MSTALLIMAKAPRPGEVKTRLEPLLGPDGCARLQTELIRHTSRWAAGCTRRSWLAIAPADGRPEVADLLPAGVTVFPQRGCDLGARLRDATARCFRTHRAALSVIGTDAPELGPVHLRFAELALADGNDACLIPALDGGYAMIALARPIPQAFDVPPGAWGGPDVLDLTVRALHAAGRSCAVLEPVRDLDTPDDARWVAADPRCPAAIRHILRGRIPA
jgi:rSAM/selenodomain-associated transferase 1